MDEQRKKPETPEEREARVAELRRRWLEGTLDDVLVPKDGGLDRLIGDLEKKTATCVA